MSWVCTRLCKLQKGVHSTRSSKWSRYQLLAHGRWFSPGTPYSSTTKTGRHDIAEILLKVVLNTINQIKSLVLWHCKCLYLLTVFLFLPFRSTWANHRFFGGIRVARSLFFFRVVFALCLPFILPLCYLPSIYEFWLHLRCLKSRLMNNYSPFIWLNIYIDTTPSIYDSIVIIWWYLTFKLFDSFWLISKPP